MQTQKKKIVFPILPAIAGWTLSLPPTRPDPPPLPPEATAGEPSRVCLVQIRLFLPPSSLYVAIVFHLRGRSSRHPLHPCATGTRSRLFRPDLVLSLVHHSLPGRPLLLPSISIRPSCLNSPDPATVFPPFVVDRHSQQDHHTAAHPRRKKSTTLLHPQPRSPKLCSPLLPLSLSLQRLCVSDGGEAGTLFNYFHICSLILDRPGLLVILRLRRRAMEQRLMMKLLILLLLSDFSHAFITGHHLLNRLSGTANYLTDKELWLHQTLDHFSPYDHTQFKQRYYEFLDYFRVPDGPVFLKICGESACNGIANDYLSVLAKKFGAAIVSLEHRYYGKSSPFKSLTTENLRFLSSKQALFDLAYFRQHYQETLNLKLNRTNVENPWFVFGISYPGALSAWFRLKFPHLTCGSLASSAVVEAVYNFPEFDKQIGESAGAECKAALQKTTQLVEQRLESDRKAVKTLFSAAELEIDGDFLYYLADSAVMAFQYGNPDELCSPLVEANKDGKDLVDAYAKYVKEQMGDSVQTYNQKALKNTALSKHSGDRLWWFQVCTEVAYFQVAPSNDSLRSSKVDMSYHLDLCKNVFGEGIYPDVDGTNLYYGGTKIAGSKIIFTNGSQDPWRHASKQVSSETMPSYIVSCHNCGHGTDMRGCPQSPLSLEGNAQNCSSPDAVHKVRQQMIEHIDLWLSQCQVVGRSCI